MSKAGDLFPDVHFKMSKKIAQLTKVIYQLNSKNEDHQIDLDHQQANHSEEIQSILKDATAKISKFKDALETKQKLVNEEAYIEKLTKKYEYEKQQAMNDLAKYKTIMKENEEKMSDNHSIRFTHLKSQITTMNTAFSVKIKEFESKFDEKHRLVEENTTALKKRHIEETKRLIESANKKYEDSMNENVRLREAYIVDSEKRLVEGKESVRKEMLLLGEKEKSVLRLELDEEHKDAMLKLQNRLGNQMQEQANSFSSKLEASFEEIRIKTSELSACKANVVELRGKIDDLQRVISQQEGDIDANRRALMEEVSSTRQELNTRGAQLQESREETGRLGKLLAQTSKSVADLEAKCIVHTNTVETMTKMHESESAKWANKEKELLARIEHISVDLEQSRNSSEVLTQELVKIRRELKEEAERQSLEKKQLEQRIMDLSSELDAAHASTTAADEQAALMRQMASRELEYANDKIETELIIRSKYETEIAELSESILELKSKMIDADTAAKLLAQSVEIEYTNAYNNQVKEMELLGEKHKEEMSEARRAIATAAGDAEAVRVAREQDRVTAMTKTQFLQGSVESMESANRGLRSELDDARDAITSLTAQLDRAISDMQSKNSSFEDQLQDSTARLESKWRDNMSSVMAEHGRTIEAIREEYTKKEVFTLESLRKEHDAYVAILLSDKAGLSSEVARLTSLLSQEIDAKSREISMAKGSAESLRIEFEQSLAIQRQELETAMSLELDRLQSRLNDEAEEKERLVLRLHATSLDELRTSVEKTCVERVAKVTADSEAMLKQARIEAASVLEKAKQQHTLDMRNKSSDLLAQHAMELSTLRNEKEEAITRVSSELAKVVKRLSIEETKSESLQREAELMRLRYESDREKQTTEFVLQISNLKSASEYARIQLEQRFDSEMESLKRCHSDVLNEFEEQRRQLVEQNAQLETRWHSRASRAEDVAKIRELEHELDDKISLLQRTKDEMMYFKREMINREESYNTKFNVSPVVGVMNVVKQGGGKDMSKKPPKGGTTGLIDPSRRASLNSVNPASVMPTVGAGLMSGDDSSVFMSKTKPTK